MEPMSVKDRVRETLLGDVKSRADDFRLWQLVNVPNGSVKLLDKGVFIPYDRFQLLVPFETVRRTRQKLHAEEFV